METKVTIRGTLDIFYLIPLLYLILLYYIFLNAGCDSLNRFYDPLIGYDMKFEKHFYSIFIQTPSIHFLNVSFRLFKEQNKKTKICKCCLRNVGQHR